MGDLEDFNTVHYSAWHFPCYRKLNCQPRHFQAQRPEKYEEIVTEKPEPELSGNIFRLEFGSVEAGASFALLSVFIVTTFAGSVFICGALFSNRGGKRPFNQV